MSQLPPQIEFISPALLKPYARNARVHSRKQVRQIADSVRRFGFTRVSNFAGLLNGITPSTPVTVSWDPAADGPTRRPAIAPEPRIDNPLCRGSISGLHDLTLGQAITRTSCANPSGAPRKYGPHKTIYKRDANLS